MTIRISPRATKELKRIPKLDQIAIGQKIRTLRTANPIEGEKLTEFPRLFRVRVGNYRVVYHCMKTDIYIILIGHRKDVYKKLIELFG